MSRCGVPLPVRCVRQGLYLANLRGRDVLDAIVFFFLVFFFGLHFSQLLDGGRARLHWRVFFVFVFFVFVSPHRRNGSSSSVLLQRGEVLHVCQFFCCVHCYFVFVPFHSSAF